MLRIIPFALCLAVSGLPVFAQDGRMPPSISVSGSAEIKVAPDEIHMTLGVESRARNLAEAKATNDTKVAAVLKYLKGAGVDAKDIQTDYVGITPNYRSGDDITPAYYSVQRNIGVRVRKVADFEKLLQGSLTEGVTHVHGIEFRTTQLRKHRDAARQQAIRAAKEKAEALAKDLEVEVGKVQTINENSWGGYSSWSGGYWGNRGNFNFSQSSVQAAPAGGQGGEDSALSVGQISVNASVNVTFLLK